MRSLLFVSALIATGTLHAQTRTSTLDPLEDPRGKPELTVCSQNLENYGTIKAVRERVAQATQEMINEKEVKLIARFVKAGCDVIAVQELLGADDEEAVSSLKHLALLLQRRTGRFFAVRAGASAEGTLHVGFLVAQDRAEILNSASYSKVELPKLNENQKPRFFSRGPLEVQLDVMPQGETIRKNVTLITFHFKSRAGGAKDPSGLEWETYRLEEAEALRRIIENRYARAFASGESLLGVLGDRNGNFDVASTKILEGVLNLKHFQKDGPCRLSKRGVPLCLKGSTLPMRLFSVLTTDPQTKNLPGTFDLKGTYSWLDDILLPAESLRFANRSFDVNGDYDSGVVYQPKDASDHALIYVRLNW